MALNPTQRRRIGRTALGLALTSCLTAGVGGAAESALVVEQLTSQALPGLRADVATLMMQGVSGGAIDLAAVADVDPRTRPDGKKTLNLVVEASGESLLSAVENAADKSRLSVEFYAYVVDGDGLVVSHLARRVVVAVADWGERLASGGVRFVESLEVPDRELFIRSLVLIPAAGRFGMAVSEVKHYEIEGAHALGRPGFEDFCDDWLPVVTRDSAVPVRKSARPLWLVGERVEALVRVDAGDPISDQAIVGLLASANGELLRIEPAVERRGRLPDEIELALGFDVPEVEVGVYSFTVAASEGSARESVASEVWIVNRSNEALAANRSACAWPQVMQEARRMLADIAPITSIADRGGSLRRRTRRAYVDLLRRLGDGEDLATTVDGLVEWEGLVTHEAVQKNMAVLLAVQTEVLQDLAKADPESLLPLFKLHQAAYREHFQRHNFALAGHSRRVAATIAEICISRSDRGEEVGWVADALVSLAETADQHFMFAASQFFLERAAEVDPKNRAARLLLSMLYEKLGEYQAAVGHLERLLESAPADAEGRLRLATLQRRLGRLDASRDSLRRVIGQRPQPWILSLAYQTLVKELYAEESFGEGLRVLAEAELLLPGDPALGLAKAYGMDRLGRGREAVKILSGLPYGSEEGRSFRLFYAESDEGVVRGVDTRLSRNVMIRQPRLRQAVAQVFGEAG